MQIPLLVAGTFRDVALRLGRIQTHIWKKARRDGDQDERLAQLEREVLELRCVLLAVLDVVRSKSLATAEEIGAALDRAVAETENAAKARNEAALEEQKQRQSRLAKARAARAQRGKNW
jgi:Mg2+ and Co2+ transporter CorA